MQETNLGKTTNTKNVNSKRTYSKLGQEKAQENNTVRFNPDKVETAREKKSVQNICTDRERKELKTWGCGDLLEASWRN